MAYFKFVDGLNRETCIKPIDLVEVKCNCGITGGQIAKSRVLNSISKKEDFSVCIRNQKNVIFNRHQCEDKRQCFSLLNYCIIGFYSSVWCFSFVLIDHILKVTHNYVNKPRYCEHL